MPGCVPLDLFGGQGRPFTQEMIDLHPHHADRFEQADPDAGLGQHHRRPVQHRRPHCGLRRGRRTSQVRRRFPAGSAAPDRRVAGLVCGAGLGQTTTSTRCTPSSASRCSRHWMSVPRCAGLTTRPSAAKPPARSASAGSPVEALAFRGTYSKGFRAPNLGELYGLTQFGATLTDPCGPTGAPRSCSTPTVPTPRRWKPPAARRACRPGFEQANTQITTFTGGNRGSAARDLGQLHRGHRARRHLGGRLRRAADLRAHLLQLRDRQRHPGARHPGAAQRLPRGGRHGCRRCARRSRARPAAISQPPQQLPRQPGFDRNRWLRLQGRLAGSEHVMGRAERGSAGRPA